jgi:hypothetical protein
MNRRTPVVICFVTLTVTVGCGGSPDALSAPTPSPAPNPAPAPTGADALLAECPSTADVAASDRDLMLTFENDPTAHFQVACTAAQSSRDLTLLQAQVYRVLTIARRLTFDAPLPWTSDSLYPWLVSAIRGIRLRNDITGSFCCDPANIINIQTRNLAALQFPSDFRWVGTLLVLFVHEARHSNGFPHTCGANDNTIGELGAWGVQYHMSLFLGTRSDPAFISSTARAAFAEDARATCSNRFCRESCP